MNTQADITAAEKEVKQAKATLAAAAAKHKALEAQLETLEQKEASWVYQAEFAGNPEAQATLATTRARLAETKTQLADSDGKVDQAKATLAEAETKLESAITGELLFRRAKKERELTIAWIEQIDAQQVIEQTNLKIGRLELELQPLAANLRARLKPQMFDGTFVLPYGDREDQAAALRKRLEKLDAELAGVD